MTDEEVTNIIHKIWRRDILSCSDTIIHILSKKGPTEVGTIKVGASEIPAGLAESVRDKFVDCLVSEGLATVRNRTTGAWVYPTKRGSDLVDHLVKMT